MYNFSVNNYVLDNYRNSGRVFVVSNLIRSADEWFDKNDVNMMNEPSKTWKKVKRKGTTYINKVLKEELNAIKVNFSPYAGCSCPCSPGWVVKGGSFDYEGEKEYVNGKSIWVTINFDEITMDKFNEYLQSMVPVLKEELEKEVA